MNEDFCSFSLFLKQEYKKVILAMYHEHFTFLKVGVSIFEMPTSLLMPNYGV